MEGWEPGEGWPEWQEELDLLQWVHRPRFARPAGLARLGGDSYVVKPYKIRSPHRLHVGDRVVIGERSFFSIVESDKGVKFDPVVRIGDGTGIGSDLFLACTSRIEIGKNVGIGVGVFIGDTGRDDSDPTRAAVELELGEQSAIRIGDGALVAPGAIVLPGVTVGERAYVGTGAVVTRDVPPLTVVFGNPARVVRRWDAAAGKWRMGGGG